MNVFEVTGLKKFTSTRPIFRTRNFICGPDRASKKMERKNKTQCAQLIEKQLAEAHSPTDAHSGASKASQMELFARIINVFKLTFLTFFFFKRLHRRYLQGTITPLLCFNAGN